MADNFKLVQAQSFTLAGAGVSAGDTTMTLQTFAQIDGTLLTMSNFGIIGYGTVQPDSRDLEEQISFTGVTQNANGSATLTGVKTVGMVSPYTETSGFAAGHVGGSTFVISNTAGFYNKFVSKLNDEYIEGIYTFDSAYIPKMSANVTPSDQTQLATKKYVDDTAAGVPVPINKLVVVAVAGETVAAGNQVYFDETDNEWKKTSATFVNQTGYLTGIAQGAGTDGNPISGGVLLFGLDSNQSGLTPTDLYYLSDTSGAISTTPGTITFEVGYAYSATELYYTPKFKSYVTAKQKEALAGNNGTPSSSNTFVTQTGFQRGQEVYAASSGGTDTYSITLSPVPAALVTGMCIRFKADVANTGACSLNIGVGGAVAIKYNVSTDPVSNTIIANQITTVVYDGTNWQLQKASNLLEGGTESNADTIHTHAVERSLLYSNHFGDDTNLTVTLAGTGTATFDTSPGVVLNVSAASDAAVVTTGIIYDTAVTFGDAITFGIIANWSAVGSNRVGKIVFGVCDNSVMGGAVASGALVLTARHFAFIAEYVDNTTLTLKASSADGTTQQTTTIAGVTVTNTNAFQIVHTPTSDRFYVNGTLQATHTTNVASGSTGIESPFRVSSHNTAGGGVSRDFNVGPVNTYMTP